MDQGRFSSHFLLSVDNMCLSFFSLSGFSEKMLTCTILSQSGEGPDPILIGDLPSPFPRPQWTWVDFPAPSFYPWTTCVFPSLVSESFLKKCWRAQFYLKMAKALTRFFWWFLLSISTPTMDRGRFSSHFLLSVDNMCLSFFSLWEFSEKMLTCTILSQSGEGPDTILFGDLPSPFQRPQWTGVDFFLLSGDNMCLSFYPKKCWRTTCVISPSI